ncbi:FKBP-type peptidyl-prolyl cis-trans isomerase [Trichlorobacter lovleyi]|uniref:FKBP-type peptidyl-prolyl cis-trans isomerase n=1 Tax=Trichlorobacter lovleyi TaxID=313985 RepID=UPI0024806746|nr:FKBP-type peptidyl-prolyl cis-trans isomerase [Trichlorobacter lovleyi]
MRPLLVLAVLAVAAQACALEPPKTEEQKTLYAIGQTVSRQLSVFNLSADEFQYVLLGLTDAQSGNKAAAEPAQYNRKIQELARSRRAAHAQKLGPANKEALEKAAKEQGAVKTASGLIYLPVKEGDGAQPKLTDTVRVNYRGILVDGKEFDSSYKRGNPLEFKLDSVIKCWTEGVQKMKVGGKAKLTCPAALAYGEQGAGDLILPGATLQFEVELLDIKK